MRAWPGVSLEYFGLTAFGNTAVLYAAGADPLVARVVRLAVVGAAVESGVEVEAAGLASAPHWALRKSFHFIPCNVPADCASLYFALHSFIVSAVAGLWTAIASAKAIDVQTSFV